MKTTDPPSSAKNRWQEPQKKRKQYIKHSTPEGLRQGLNRLMNKIIACDDPLSHAGQYASLANAMTNSQKFSMEVGEWKKVQDRLNELEKNIKK